MGRPLNSRFFQSGTGGPGDEVGCNAWFTGQGGAESSYIINQRSNSKYTVGSDAGGATPTRTEVLRLVQGAPAAVGEMQVEVQAENAQAVVQAEIGFTSAGGTGALTGVSVAVAGYGYWANGTNVALSGTTDGTVDYQVADGSVVAVQVNTAGSGNTQAESPNDLGDAPAADPPLQSARIINARTVKTFEGNTFLWPIVGVDDGAGPSGRTEADLQAAT